MAEAQTIIGESITISGEVTSEEDVSIRGRLNGRINTTADLQVEQGGIVEAEIHTRSIDVHGTIVGNITAADRLQVHPGGNVTGDLRAPRILLADGAKYKGNIDMSGLKGE